MLKWQDVITLDEKSAHGFPEQAKDIAAFLEKVQSTPEGQQLFADIKAKHGSQHARINFDNNPRTMHLNGSIHINLQDIEHAEVKDAATGKYERAGLPYLVYHELTHAADPRLRPVQMHFQDGNIVVPRDSQQDPYTKPGPNGIPPSEAAATARTEKFMQRYYPELPDWKKYSDFRITGETDPGIALLEAGQNPKVSDKELVDICTQTMKFQYGEVTAEDAHYCQTLPNSRPGADKKKLML